MTEEKVSLVITIYSSDDCTVLSSMVCGLFTWSLQHHRARDHDLIVGLDVARLGRIALNEQ